MAAHSTNIVSEPVMVSFDDPKGRQRRYHCGVAVDHYYYPSMTREVFEQYIKDQIKLASDAMLELIMRDYDNPKSS
jgi:hypothetical protein